LVGWDQSDNYIKIYISDINGLDKVKQDNLKFEFTEKSLSLEIHGLNGRSHSLLINDLLYPIVPSGCGVKAKSNMVIVTLKKSSLGRTWDVLTGREKKIKDSREMKPSKPDKDEDPGVGLMKMMQKLYDEGDDEMKRTIKKAWHESQEKKMKGEDLSV
jgi:calcyclin binding protein